IISLQGRYDSNNICISIIGKTVKIFSENRWYISPEKLDRFNLSNYNLLKSNFEPNLCGNDMFVTFEHVTYLHTDPTEFGEYLLMLIDKFDTEIDEITDKCHLRNKDVRLPPVPDIITVGI
nr:hypothetical protein [Lachnospiraceae bacterium]